MADKKSMFRKQALQKMASPERLDELMEVTAPAGWYALGALALMLCAALLWSVFGRIAIKVHGNGLLIRGGAVLDVSLASAGRVRDIYVQPGDVVEEGTLLAKVNQGDLALRLENTQEELDALLSQNEEAELAAAKIVAQLENQARELRQKVGVQERMRRQGLVTKGTLLSTKSQLASTEQSIAQEQAKSTARGNRVADLQRDIEELERQLSDSSEVRSPYAGRVLELMVDAGNLVAPGRRLLTLESLEGPIDAVVYVPAADGKKIKDGMPVRISPSTVRAEEYGFILGEVSSASEYPVTPEGMARVLRNEKLVATLTGSGAMIEVVAALTPDPETPSGFRWSSSEGPPTKVFTGTICSVAVIVEEKRPISYVLPIFKRAVGG